MALPIQPRPRIKLTDPEDTPLPRARRSPVLAVGLLAWLASVAVAWGVQAGTIPVAQWLEQKNAPDRASARFEREREREPLLEIPQTPAPEPAPIPAPLPPADNEPIAPAEEPPIALVEPEPAPATASELPEAAPWMPTPANSRAKSERRGREPRASEARGSLAMRSIEPAPPPAPPSPSPLPAPAPPPPPEREKPADRNPGTSAGSSCEAAVAAYREEIKIGGGNGPADLSASDYGAVLNRGAWFSGCSVPDSAAIDVCVAVRNGHAVGVTVRTSPHHAGAERCIARAARGLAFPSHPKLDVARTHFDAE